jgi:hypothetical protein
MRNAATIDPPVWIEDHAFGSVIAGLDPAIPTNSRVHRYTPLPPDHPNWNFVRL